LKRVAGQGSSRDRLLHAGKALFAQRGFDGATTAAIAKAAGTSQSQLIKHFGDKHGVLAAALDSEWQQLNSAITLAIARISKPVEQLRLALNMFLSTVEKNVATGAVLALDGGAVHQADGQPYVSSGYQQFAGMLESIVEAMRLQGELRAEVHPRALRSVLMGCLEKFVRDKSVATAIGGFRYSETDLQIVLFRVLAGCAPSKATPAADAAQAASVPLELAAGPDDDAWIRQYTGLAETLLKTPPGEA
jgi:AcrR family transcriptional regulator